MFTSISTLLHDALLLLLLQMLYPEISTSSAAAVAAVTPEQISAAEQAVLQQADLVRQLKDGGQDNASPEVQKQVQVCCNSALQPGEGV